MTVDIYYLLKSKKIILLPGYSNSSGAKTEIAVGEKCLKMKPVQIKKAIGGKYESFVSDTERLYRKKGLESEFKSIIEPMLNANSESTAAKMVKAHIPSKETDDTGQRYNESINKLDEGVIDNIVDFIKNAKNFTLEKVLGLIGKIFNKGGVKKITR